MLVKRPNAQVTSLVFNIALSGQTHLRQCLFVCEVKPRAWDLSAQRTTHRGWSVLVTSGGIILALLEGPAASAFFASTAMASVPAMPKHMHGDKGDRDQDPEPVCRYPIHET